MVYKNIKRILLENFNFKIVKNENNYNVVYICIYNKNFIIIIKSTVKKDRTFKIDNSNCLYFSIWSGLDKYLSNNTFIFLNQFFKYKYFKIKFTGKGYKIKKKKRIFFFLFNRAHPTRIWWRYIFFKKFRKYKMYLKSTNFSNSLAYNLLNIRKINIFTKKGLRLTRQKRLKKKGKK